MEQSYLLWFIFYFMINSCPYLLFCVGPDSVGGIATGRSGDRLWIPVAERPKARVYSRSLAEVTGSNPAGGMDIYVVSKECRTVMKNNEIRMKYRVQDTTLASLLLHTADSAHIHSTPL